MVEVAEALFLNQSFPLGATVPQGWGVEAEGFRELADEADILQLEGGSATGSEITADHAIAVQVENPAFREPAEERLADESRIDACQFGETQGLGDGVDGLGDDELVGEFGDLA